LIGSRPRSARCGLTLIELLVSMAIAVVVVALVVSLYRTVARTVDGQQARARGPHAAAQAINVMRDDLTALILPPEDLACVFTVGPTLEDGARGPEIALCTLVPGDTEHGLNWSQPMRMVYRVAAAEGHTAALVRVRQALSGPAALAGAETNVLLNEVALFAVSVFDGTTWHVTWPPADPKAPPPILVRLELTPAEAAGRAEGYATDILLPVGVRVTSTVVRASGTAEEAPAPDDASTLP